MRYSKSKLPRVFLIFCFVLLLAACEQDNYDKGEGTNSQMRADFVEAHVNGDKRIDYVVTDDGDSLGTDPLFTTKAIETADTIYRGILYYNKVKKNDGKNVAEVKGMSLVPTLVPVPPTVLESMKQDPLSFESIWLSRNKRFLNVSIILKTGKVDEEDLYQTIAVAQDNVEEHDNGTKTLCCRLYHDQNNVPEYYSAQRYFSIPIRSLTADSLRLTIKTYSGETVKTLAIK